MKRNLLFFAFTLWSCFLLSSCAQPEHRYNIQELIHEIDASLEKEEIDATIKLIDNTLYVYVPVEKLFVETDKTKSNFINFSVNYLNGAYKNKVFYYNFSIKKLPEKRKNTHNLSFDETTRKIAQKVQYAVTNKYMNSDTEIEFIVESYADINQGYIFSYITYHKDLEKYFCGALPYEEYSKRIVQDYIQSEILINNKNAVGLEFEGVTKETFLSKQITQRINNYFSREIPPNTSIKDTITNIIKHTLKYYQFNDYLLVQLEDLYKEKLDVFSKTEIEDFRL
ncbi:MAG: hypothetical protein P9L96_04315 [Candidatus Gygaella obscura]|nr:hypothetical protein [Candidatus Gygaella obscura]